MDVPRPETPRHTWLILCTLHTTLDSTVQRSCMNLEQWFYYYTQGKHWSKTARHTGPLHTSTNPPTSVNCTRNFIICNTNLHLSQTSCKRLGYSGAKKEVTQSGRSEEIYQTRKVKPKTSTSYSYHWDKKNFFLAAQTRTLNLKVPLGVV
jgi:hypothetical protein